MMSHVCPTRRTISSRQRGRPLHTPLTCGASSTARSSTRRLCCTSHSTLESRTTLACPNETKIYKAGGGGPPNVRHSHRIGCITDKVQSVFIHTYMDAWMHAWEIQMIVKHRKERNKVNSRIRNADNKKHWNRGGQGSHTERSEPKG
jgi:hypothetical protein